MLDNGLWIKLCEDSEMRDKQEGNSREKNRNKQ